MVDQNNQYLDHIIAKLENILNEQNNNVLAELSISEIAQLTKLIKKGDENE